MDEPASRLLLFNDSPNSLLSTAFAGDLTVSAISVIGLATPIETLPATTSTKSAFFVQVAFPLLSSLHSCLQIKTLARLHHVR